MALAEKIHLDRDGSFQRTVTEDGSAKDLSSATKIEVEFYTNPGTAICSFNTTDHAGNFDNTLASGIVKFVWTSSTFSAYESSMIAGGKYRGRVNARIVIYTATHTNGYVVPDPFVCEFRK